MTNSISNSLLTAKLHVVMFPWFAFGHFTPYLHLSNELAERGHRVSFLLPSKASIKLQDQNLHPDLITFHSLIVPSVEGLPQGAETTSDVLYPSHTFLAKAFDLTRDQVEALVSSLVPGFVFYDLAHWMPEMLALTGLGCKAVMFSVIAPARVCKTVTGKPSTELAVRFLDLEFGSGVSFRDRIKTAVIKSDAICFRTCMEIDEEIVEHMESIWEKPVLLTGSLLPEEDGSMLDTNWDKWLNTFSPPNKVIYCALGTQIVLDKAQFQEIVLGFEATGLPFLAVLKPPVGCSSIEEALPEGFKERVEGRGIVYGGWVQQRLILKHASVGCFVSHCGYGSMWEALLSECQIVWLPYLLDQVMQAKRMAEDMKAAVVVERDENGRVTKERVCEAIKSVMDEGSETGLMVRRNHFKYRKVLTKEGFMSGCIDKLLEGLQGLNVV